MEECLGTGRASNVYISKKTDKQIAELRKSGMRMNLSAILRKEVDRMFKESVK